MRDVDNPDAWRQYLDVPHIPVPGDPDEARGAASAAAGGAVAVAEVAFAFGRFASVDNGEFEGDTARAFYDRATEIHAQLEAARPIFEDLAAALHDHANRLASLKADASHTIRRAKLQWTALQEAQLAASTADQEFYQASSTHADAVRRVELWERELDGLTPDDGGYWNAVACRDEAVDDRDDAGRDKAAATAAKNEAEKLATNAQEVLASLRSGRHYTASWDRLCDETEQLDKTTRDAIDALELGPLDDPNFVQAAYEDARDWVVDFVGDLGALIEAGLEGRWSDAMHHLLDVLDKLSFILMVLEIVVITGLIAFGGPAGAALAVAMFKAMRLAKMGIAAGEMLATAALVRSGHPHPETDEILGAGDLGIALMKGGLTMVMTNMKHLPIRESMPDWERHVFNGVIEGEGHVSNALAMHEQASRDADWRHGPLDDLRDFEGPQIEPDWLIDTAGSSGAALEAWASPCQEPVSFSGTNSVRLATVSGQ